MAEGVHWLPGTDMADVAWKLVAVNLSDLAAKGAEPLGILLSYSLGEDDDRFIYGLRDVCTRYDIALIGGDTIRVDGPRTLSLTAIGKASHAPVPSRSGAQAGDDIFLCGTIGDAYRGFTELTAADSRPQDGSPSPDSYFIERLQRPRPLLDEGRTLAPLVTAMMDVSDGLFLDAQRMALASGVTFSLDFETLPFSDQFVARLNHDQTDAATDERSERIAAAGWGDDYALLFTLPQGVEPPVRATRIGEVTEATDNPLLLDRCPLPPDAQLGFTH